MINSVCGIRSTGRICTDLADVLKLHGHECKIVYGREKAPEKYIDVSYRIGNEGTVKLNGLLSRLFDNEGFNAKKQTKELVSFMMEYKPDIVHLHNLHGYYLNIQILLNYLANNDLPVIWTMHDCWAVTGHCSHFTTINCEKWKTGCYHCEKSSSYPRSILIDASRQNWKKKKELFLSLNRLYIVTPSEWLAEIMRNSFLNQYSISAIPNGVDLESFKPTHSDFREEYHLENKKIVLGVATSWNENKGLNEFIHLQDELGKDYQVVLVGLTKRILDNLPPKIIGIRRTNSLEELAGLYTTADVFLNAGQQETMGLTTVEAMACGTPVVVSNLTAVPEVVDEKGGVVFKDYSVKAMAEKIRQVIASEYKYTRETAFKYEKSRQYEKYIALYERIVCNTEDKVLKKD